MYLLQTGSYAKLEYVSDAGKVVSYSSLLHPREDQQNNVYTCDDRENIMTKLEQVILEQT